MEAREQSGNICGPVEQKLQEFGQLKGLVFGAWAEASEHVHELVDTMAKSRVQSQERTRGTPGNKHELGLITAQIRRRLSQVVIKAQVECLLGRLHQVGPGTKAMLQRRDWALREEQAMKRERDAQWLRRTEGVFTLRKGQIKTA